MTGLTWRGVGSLELPKGVPGVAVAELRGAEVSHIVVLGRRCHAGAALDDRSVFEAASLTKPLFEC